MSNLDQLRATLLNANEQAEQVAAALQHNVQELEQINAVLGHTSDSSNSRTVAEGAIAIIGAARTLRDAQDLIRVGTDSVSQYVAEL